MCMYEFVYIETILMLLLMRLLEDDEINVKKKEWLMIADAVFLRFFEWWGGIFMIPYFFFCLWNSSRSLKFFMIFKWSYFYELLTSQISIIHFSFVMNNQADDCVKFIHFIQIIMFINSTFDRIWLETKYSMIKCLFNILDW